jgi:hypothetical protein
MLVSEVVFVTSSELFWLRAACSARSCTESGAGLEVRQRLQCACTGCPDMHAPPAAHNRLHIRVAAEHMLMKQQLHTLNSPTAG